MPTMTESMEIPECGYSGRPQAAHHVTIDRSTVEVAVQLLAALHLPDRKRPDNPVDLPGDGRLRTAITTLPFRSR